MGSFPAERCLREVGDFLTKLADLDGVAGFEEPVADAIEALLGTWPDEIRRDALGNLLALKRGTRNGPSLLLAAHMDEIGMAVSHIEPGGFIRFEKIGGVIDSLLVGRMVKVRGYHGVIGVKPGHYQSPEDRKQIPPYHDMFIDLGLDSRDEVERLGIAIGDPIVFDSPLVSMAGGHRVAGKAVDNRLGCAILLQLARSLGTREPAGDLWLAFTVQEEVGLRGAQTAAYGLNPDYAVAIDTIPCGGTPDVPTSRAPTRIGKGPVLPLISQGGARGSFMHPAIKAMLTEIAECENLPYQPYLFYAGTNDASSMHLVRAGIPSGSICIPRRYSHSPVEMADLRDAVVATRMLIALVSRVAEAPRPF